MCTMAEIFCVRDRTPGDDEIVSFFHMVFAPDQTRWNLGRCSEEIMSKTDEEFVAFCREKVLTNTRNHGFWAKVDDRVVGMAGINQFEDEEKPHCVELGFGVSEDFQRQGIGYRLISAAIDRARTLGLKRIESDCFADNAAAVGLLGKAGFTEEGVRYRAVLRDGHLRDVRLFGLLIGA